MVVVGGTVVVVVVVVVVVAVGATVATGRGSTTARSNWSSIGFGSLETVVLCAPHPTKIAANTNKRARAPRVSGTVATLHERCHPSQLRIGSVTALRVDTAIQSLLERCSAGCET